MSRVKMKGLMVKNNMHSFPCSLDKKEVKSTKNRGRVSVNFGKLTGRMKNRSLSPGAMGFRKEKNKKN